MQRKLYQKLRTARLLFGTPLMITNPVWVTLLFFRLPLFFPTDLKQSSLSLGDVEFLLSGLYFILNSIVGSLPFIAV